MFKLKVFAKNLISTRSGSFFPIRIFLLAALIAALILPSVNSIVSAQQTDSPWYEVRTIYTEDYGVKAPTGIAFSPKANAFLLWKDNGDVIGVGMNEAEVDTQKLNLPVEDARNLAFNEFTNSLLVLGNANTRLDEFSVNEKGIPVADSGPSQVYNLRALNLSEARGMAFDPNSGRMFILDSSGNRLTILAPAAGTGLDGDSAMRENRVKQINLKTLDYTNQQGIAYNPNNEHLYLLDAINQKVYEITLAGEKVS